MGRTVESAIHHSKPPKDGGCADQIAELLADRPFYKSGDVMLADALVIPPGATRTARFILDPTVVDLLQHVPITALDELSVTTKSRCAQAGLEVGLDEGKIRHGMYEYSEQHGAFVVNAAVRNHAMRTLSVEAYTSAYRYYRFDPENKLEGDDLERELSTNQIFIKGDRRKVSDDGTSILIPIDPSTFKALPPSFNTADALEIKKDTSKRCWVDKYMDTPQRFHMPQVLVGTTPHIYLREGYEGVLHTNTKIVDGEVVMDNNHHLNSVVFDGKITNRRAQVEIVQYFELHPEEEWVALDIYKH